MFWQDRTKIIYWEGAQDSAGQEKCEVYAGVVEELSKVWI